MNFVKKVKNYFAFTNKELTDMGILALATAFMLSFKEWGVGDTYNALVGLKNLFNTFLITSIAVLVHESAHKLAAIHKGYVAEHKPWWSSILFGIMLTFITQGNMFFFGFGVLVYHLAGERLGTFRFGFNMKDVGFIALAGPMGNLAMVILFKIVFLINNSPYAEKAMLINIWFAAFNMLPIPWVDGGDVFFGGRTRYVFFIALIGVLSVLLYLSSSIIQSMIFGVVLAAGLAAFWSYSAEGIVE